MIEHLLKQSRSGKRKRYRVTPVNNEQHAQRDIPRGTRPGVPTMTGMGWRSVRAEEDLYPNGIVISVDTGTSDLAEYVKLINGGTVPRYTWIVEEDDTQLVSLKSLAQWLHVYVLEQHRRYLLKHITLAAFRVEKGGSLPRSAVTDDKNVAVALSGWSKNDLTYLYAVRDGCEFCDGKRGGVPGNENISGGKLICDYCTADEISERRAREQREQESRRQPQIKPVYSRVIEKLPPAPKIWIAGVKVFGNEYYIMDDETLTRNRSAARRFSSANEIHREHGSSTTAHQLSPSEI